MYQFLTSRCIKSRERQLFTCTILPPLGTLTWTSIQPPANLVGRAGHVAFYRTDSNENKENNNNGVVVIFGGGNNKDHYFKDLVTVTLS